MSDITYKEVVEYLRESTGDANWYLNNKIGLPVAHRYMNAVSVRNQVTEAIKKLKEKKTMKDEDHGDYAFKAHKHAQAGKKTMTIGGEKHPVTASGKLDEVMCNECGMAETKCACMKKEEVKKWIKGAIKHKGALHKALGVPAGEKIPAKKLAAAAHEPGKLGKQARLAKTLKKMHEDSAAERDHTHAAHFHDHKGNWSGMALITAKSDEDAVKQAHELAQSDRYKDFKLAHVEKHTAVKDLDEVLDPSMGASKYVHDFVHSDNPKFHGKSKKERIRMALGAYYGAKKEMKEATVISSEEELNEILEESFFLNEGKAERAAKAREAAINNIKLGKGSVAMRKRLAAMHGVHHVTGEPLSGAKKDSKDDSKPSGSSSILKKLTPAEVARKNKERQDAYYARGGREGMSSGGGSSNVSPLDKAISKVSDKPKKGAGASPAELAAAKAEKKAAEKKKPSDTTKRLTGKIEEAKKAKKEELNTDMLKDTKSSLKRKYLGAIKGRTHTGGKAHKVVIDPTIEDAKT